MTRYKLIKEYPGSPEKGTIVYHPHKQKAYWEEYKTKNKGNVRNFIFYSKGYIENYPKFWQKIK